MARQARREHATHQQQQGDYQLQTVDVVTGLQQQPHRQHRGKETIDEQDRSPHDRRISQQRMSGDIR